MPDPKRHITFNGRTNDYYNLVLAGNTPLFIPKPKQSSIEVPYAHGTVDTTELNGRVYWEGLTVSYSLFIDIPIFNNGVARSSDQMNALCNAKVEQVEAWLYSGPATLEDTGTDHVLYDATCAKVTSDKSCGLDSWILRFTAQFSTPNVDIRSDKPPVINTKRNGRFIIYNGLASYTIGLDILGVTPTTIKSPKNKTLNYTQRDGYLDLSHCKDGLTSGADSLFYEDREISYKFIKFFSKYNSQGKVKPAWQMQCELQTFVEQMCNWLYVHNYPEFVTIDGMVTYGGECAMLMDSAWIIGTVPDYGLTPCEFLPSARVSSLSINKTIHGDRWGLTFDITFKTYPIFSTGNIYLPPPQSQDPPELRYIPWKHYADVDSSELETTDVMMIEHSSSYFSAVDEGIYLTARETVFTYHGTGLLGTEHRPIGYTVGNNSITFSNFATPVGGESNFVIEAEHYIHESMSDYDVENHEMPVLFIIPPPLLIFEIEGTKHVFYLSYIYNATLDPNGYTNVSGNSVLTKLRHRKLVNGEVVETTNSVYGAIVAIRKANPSSVECDPFSWKLNVTYNYVGPQGMGQNHEIDLDYFINKDIDIDYRVQHVQRIHGDDILEKYGLHCKSGAYAPETYDAVPMEIVFDYTGEEPEIYYGQKEEIITVNMEAGHKFWHPEHYRERIWNPESPSGFPGWVKLQVPKVNGEGNKYTICDGSNSPKGGDIQWL